MKVSKSSRVGPVPDSGTRPSVMGKFLYVGDEKLYVRGVTYGPFRPGPKGCEYHSLLAVESDFARIAGSGINAVRTYTVPPRWVLDCAQRSGLWVLVGLPWEQHVAFLHERRLSRTIERRIRSGVKACAGHPALLGYAIGNEVPSAVVRWHGHRRVERHIEALYRVAKEVEPEALVSYVNYPTTEYLELPFVDLVCFNIYLESPVTLDAYLARLQNLAVDKPLLLAETGLDSRRHGVEGQAVALDWQIRTSFAAGCAGVFVFAWTDEWHRGGNDIAEWDFGLTRRDRSGKPALDAVRVAFGDVPMRPQLPWPRISVVVCTYNGVSTLRACIEGVMQLDYPDFEVLVVNDGSLEGVSEIARHFDVRLLNIPRSGLSAARNAGLNAATGDVVAYIDDDASPDRHWLQYLAQTFSGADVAAAGGPNVSPQTRSAIAECVAHAPGGPVHVLVSDREAEHIPGCNMAFRKAALLSIGGFDTQFRVAGDDVDICWRLRDAGLKIGFNAGAMVWHHRRQSIRSYWRQQVGYGRAEAQLERKWPAKYNEVGQPAWKGRIYGTGRVAAASWRRPRVYQGTWGSAPFQSLYEPMASHFWSLTRMPEWYLVVLMLWLVACLAPLWHPLHKAWALLALALIIPTFHALVSGRRVQISHKRHGLVGRCCMRGLIAALHLLQPLARLWGRVSSGLTPWRQREVRGFALPGSRGITIWSEGWRSPTEWLESVESPLKQAGASVFRGGDFDRWDLEVRGGVLGTVRMRMLIEEHGAGKQLVRARAWPRWPVFGVAVFVLTCAVAAGAAHDQAWAAALVFGGVALSFLLAAFAEWATATAALFRVLRALKVRSEAVAEPAGLLPKELSA